jgi:WD40 repeat protein
VGEERVFVSYARADGVDAARIVRTRLAEVGLSVWQDLVALKDGRDWWSQIEEALRSKSLEHFVLVLTPKVLESPIIRQEIRLARQEGKQFHPIRGPGFDFSTLPRWMGHVTDPDIPEQWDRLIAALRGPSRQTRAPMMAPEPPPDYVPRPQEFETLKRALLDERGDARGGRSTAFIAALRGAGGYGKTTLARALAYDLDVQEAFYDGVLWVELGERPTNLLGTLIDLIQRLTGKRPGIENINAAASALGETLGDRRILFVIDDVWSAGDLRPFLQGGPHTTRLVTTRLDGVLPAAAVRLPVDAMKPAEGFDLLATGLPPEAVAGASADLQSLSARLGAWAQLLKLANGFLRNRVGHGEALTAAITNVNLRLDEKGLTAFDARDDGGRTKAVARTIEVSLDLLDAAGRARFEELAVFAEDLDVPIDVGAALWSQTGNTSYIDAEDRLTELAGLSLLLSLDYDRRTFRLHDTTRAYIRTKAGPRLAELNGQLVTALDHAARPSSSLVHYDLIYRAEHLAEAGDRAALDALLTDPGWIDRKVTSLGGVTEIVSDYDRFADPEDPVQPLIGRTLRLISGILARNPRQTLQQLHGRFLGIEAGPQRDAFIKALHSRIPDGTLIETQAALAPPGAEIARLEKPSSIHRLVVLPDGRLAGAQGRAICLWDARSGEEVASIEGPSGWITALAVLPDGRLVSAGLGSSRSEARVATIHLWDPQTGRELARLEGHTDRVEALAVLPDRRLASGADDGTIRIWDLQTGREVARLESRTERLRALAVLPDGRLASTAGDGAIRIFDLQTGREVARLESHTEGVLNLAVLRDGRLAGGAADGTIRIWDPQTGQEVARLEGHKEVVLALAVLPDGRLASGGRDQTIRLWDPDSGSETARLATSATLIEALVVLPDGRLASGGWDRAIRFFDPKVGSKSNQLAGDSGPIVSLEVLPDGRLLSGEGGRTIRLWDPGDGRELSRPLDVGTPFFTTLAVLPDGRFATGQLDSAIQLWSLQSGEKVGRLEGHTGPVWALAALPDGRLVSGGEDKTIRLWDLQGMQEAGQLGPHENEITALAVLPDGRLASACAQDPTIWLWDPHRMQEAGRLKGHGYGVLGLAVLADGRLVSGGLDGTIRLWAAQSGREVARLEGHASPSVFAELPDGRLVSGGYDSTIHLWDLNTLQEIGRLELDAYVTSLAVSGQSGRIIAGDEIGHLHWLEIKGAAPSHSPRTEMSFSTATARNLLASSGGSHRASTEVTPMLQRPMMATEAAVAPPARRRRSVFVLALALLAVLSVGLAATDIGGLNSGQIAVVDFLIDQVKTLLAAAMR